MAKDGQPILERTMKDYKNLPTKSQRASYLFTEIVMAVVAVILFSAVVGLYMWRF